jgi:Integrase core domain
MRDEPLNETLFFRLDHARWVADYNHTRPHSALGYQAPATYAAQAPAMGDRLRHPDPARAARPLLHRRSRANLNQGLQPQTDERRGSQQLGSGRPKARSTKLFSSGD